MSVEGRAKTPQLCGHGFRRPGAFEPLARESGHGPEGSVSRHTEVAAFISLDVGREGVALTCASRSTITRAAWR